jgi:hypothetical protein
MTIKRETRLKDLYIKGTLTPDEITEYDLLKSEKRAELKKDKSKFEFMKGGEKIIWQT